MDVEKFADIMFQRSVYMINLGETLFPNNGSRFNPMITSLILLVALTVVLGDYTLDIVELRSEIAQQLPKQYGISFKQGQTIPLPAGR